MAGFYVEGLSANTANQLSQTIDTDFFNIIPVRVKYTFLNLNQLKTDNPDLFKEYGEYFALGGILFDSVTNPAPENVANSPLKNYIFAKPLFSNIKHIPLTNEITYVISFPTPNLQNPDFINLNDEGYYYFPPVNLWNSNHHNALPNPLTTSTQTPSEQKDYQQVEAGSSQKITDNTEDINLGSTFEEKEDIKPLQPYEGDVIFDGRWGQSLRFGSTVPNTDNTWSEIGDSGDPITILRNGQPNIPFNAQRLTVEDINQDLASVWMTSTQQIPINVASVNDYASYEPDMAPALPNQYKGNQVILNSGRLVLNSKTDHLLLSSNKSINLNAQESVNVDVTGDFIVQAGQILLGSKDASESVLLGDSTINLLQQILQDQKTLLDVLSGQVGVPTGTLLAPTATIAALVSSNLSGYIAQLDGLKSDYVKVE